MMRSFTLLETVIAAVLLAALAAFATGGLRTVAECSEQLRRDPDVGALSLAVDALLEDPSASGLPAIDAEGGWSIVAIPFPKASGHRLIVERHVRNWPVRAGGAQRSYALLTFRSELAAVVRWVPQPPGAGEPHE